MAQNENSKPLFTRLPQHVKPSHYQVKLHPNLSDFSVHGDVVISIRVVEPVEEISLNVLEITVDEAQFTDSEGKVLTPELIVVPETEKLLLKFGKALAVGDATLTVKFRGTLNASLTGFYRARYTSNGEERYAAATQFEPTGARKCFPCWDEPEFKATFQFTLIVPRDRTVLNNMPQISEEAHPEDPKLRVVTFDKTPLMSTYITAIFVGEVDFLEAKTNRDVIVRVYTPVGEAETGRFSLDLGVRTLEFFEDYFKVDYPLPKADMIAVPEYYGGAMENWGLITFREPCLLVDPVKTSVARKKRVGATVMHELAHMWFGNLVTMEWWTDLWLKEGFATFCQHLSGNALLPDYEYMNSLISDCYCSAFELDALRSSHPIEVPVSSPNEIDEIFDEISYSKGSVLINMIHSFIGDENFRKGMNIYLTRFAYKNSKTEDLWDCLGESSGLPVRSVMSTWTRQMGFPLVTVSLKEEGEKLTKIAFKQERFIADGSTDETTPTWLVPITVTSEKDPSKAFASFLLDREAEELLVDPDQVAGWMKVNFRQMGFYRVKYEDNFLKKLTPAIETRTLEPLDRLGVINDSFALVQANRARTVDLFDLLLAYLAEDEYVVWSAISPILSSLNTFCDNIGCQDLMDGFVRKLVNNALGMLSWNAVEGEKTTSGPFRATILRFAGLAGEPSVVEEAKRRFERHVEGWELIPADLRAPIYSIVMAFGTKETFETFKKLFGEEASSEERLRYGSAFGASKDPQILKEALEFAESESVRKQESVQLLCAVASSRLGRELAWSHFKENHKELIKRHPGAWHIGNIIQSFTCGFASHQTAQEVEEFFVKNPTGVEMTVKQSVESIRLNASWVERDAEAVKEYLQTYMVTWR